VVSLGQAQRALRPARATETTATIDGWRQCRT
jgi:hypothetical protein